MVNSNQINDKLACTLYSKNGVEIVAIISPFEGNVYFEAYVNGDYVMFSRDRKLAGTLHALNHELRG